MKAVVYSVRRDSKFKECAEYNMILGVLACLSSPKQVIATTVSQSLKIKMAAPQLSNEVISCAANLVP